MEETDRPSFENFLSKPSTLTDHLMWQLGSLNLRPSVRAAAELVIGNLNEEGYLLATEDELLGIAREQVEVEPHPAAEQKPSSTGDESVHEPGLQLVVSHTPSPEAA